MRTRRNKGEGSRSSTIIHFDESGRKRSKTKPNTNTRNSPRAQATFPSKILIPISDEELDNVVAEITS